MLPAATGPMLLPFVLFGSLAAALGWSLRPRDTRSEWATETGGDRALDYADPLAERPVARRPKWREWRDHGTRVGWVIVFVPWFVLVVHSLLHWTGKMASKRRRAIPRGRRAVLGVAGRPRV